MQGVRCLVDYKASCKQIWLGCPLLQVALLKKAKLDDRLSEFFPPSQRGIEQVNAHFQVRWPSSVCARTC